MHATRRASLAVLVAGALALAAPAARAAWAAEIDAKADLALDEACASRRPPGDRRPGARGPGLPRHRQGGLRRRRPVRRGRAPARRRERRLLQPRLRLLRAADRAQSYSEVLFFMTKEALAYSTAAGASSSAPTSTSRSRPRASASTRPPPRSRTRSSPSLRPEGADGRRHHRGLEDHPHRAALAGVNLG